MILDTKGGEWTFDASAKLPSQIGKVGYSSLSNSDPHAAARTKVCGAQEVTFAKSRGTNYADRFDRLKRHSIISPDFSMLH